MFHGRGTPADFNPREMKTMQATTSLVAGILLALSASPLVFAQQGPVPTATPQQQETRHIRRDTRTIHRDRRDVRRDQHQVNKDVAQGRFKKAQAREQDMHQDKKEVRHLQKNRRHLRRERHAQNHSGQRG